MRTRYHTYTYVTWQGHTGRKYVNSERAFLPQAKTGHKQDLPDRKTKITNKITL